MTWMNAVSPGWFHTMGMTFTAGRDFTRADDRGQSPLAIVNETFVRRFLNGQASLGQEVRLGGPGGSVVYTIAGIVRDAVYRSPREGMVPTVFVPMAQLANVGPGWTLTVAAEPGQRAAVERAVAGALAQADSRVSFTVRSFDDFIESTLVRERLTALLSSFFGGLAILLAGLGLYGLMSHAVSRRSTEIGLRMALGAAPASIARLILGRTGVLLAAGIVSGLAMSFWAAGFVSSLLFQLDARDPLVFAMAAAILVVVGLAVSWLPALRAVRLDPARVLRDG
jgi:predicted lysophospholipase L1 biosynthesis ABC-type transport system permease subunit